MPWSNQNGGGGGPWGGGGGNNQGPWGKGPQPPRGGGNPPDLEELIRRGQDRLRQALPGGGGSGGSGKLIAGLVVLGLIGLWLMQAVYTVQPDERGVELRFGKPKEEISQPGLHMILWPFETVQMVTIVEREMSTGGSSRTGSSDGLMLSGDQNIVDVEFKLLYAVSDPKAFLFKLARPEDTLRQVAESAMREVVGRSNIQPLLTQARQITESDVRELIQQTMDHYEAGVQITQVQLLKVDPPSEVIAAFRDVQAARADQERLQNEAQTYANRVIPEARGQASQITEAAIAYRDRITNEAQGQADRFTQVYESYRAAPEVTRQRMYLETLADIFAGTSKVIIDESGNGNGVIPYLPLDQLDRKSGTSGGSN